MAAQGNTAIYLEKDGQLSIRRINETYKPVNAQTLVQVKYSAINPADLRHFHMGLSGSVAGYEWVGDVIEPGSSSPFSIGQRLFGMSVPGNERPITAGAHQNYILAEEQWTYALPKSLQSLSAITLPVGAQTSADALFNVLGFAFPPANLPGEDPTGQAILIWGCSGALGQAAIQLAKVAGFSPILTTASTSNHALLCTLGATVCFDYRSSTVVDDVRAAVKASGQTLSIVYDTVATGLGFAEGLGDDQVEHVAAEYNKSSPSLAKSCCNGGAVLRLCASLPVERDSDWRFPIPYRVAKRYETPAKGTVQGLDALFEGVDPEWGNRLEQVREWILQNEQLWQPMNVRVIKGVTTGIEAIKNVFDGKVSAEKIVIEHPL